METSKTPISIQDSEITDSSLKAARVVAYRFGFPDEENEKAPRLPARIITQDGRLDIDTLEDLKMAEATLTPDQVSRFVDAVYGSHEKTDPAACYEPHHIFLFYDKDDILINVVEICFGCTNLHASPEIKESQVWRHDFRELARICDEVGIGMTSGTAEDQIRLWDEREQP